MNSDEATDVEGVSASVRQAGGGGGQFSNTIGCAILALRELRLIRQALEMLTGVVAELAEKGERRDG